ncbi:phage adaptor protein [Vibrio penaeicida]|nr:DUF6682 family protein [Vibrio penaeicida]
MALVSELIGRVSRELVDERYTRWSKPTHISNLNDAIASILLLRPDLGRVTDTTQVLADTGRVQLPVNAYKLLSVNHVNGYALQYVDLYRLNQNYPNWRTLKDPQPTNWTRNDHDDLSYFLFPTPSVPVSVEHEYARQTRIQSETEAFPLPVIYEVMVFDFMMYRAYSKDGQNE